MSRFMRGLFQTARTISTIDPTAGYGPRGEAPPAPLFVVCATLVHVFYRTSVRSNVCSVDVLRVVWYRAGTFLCMP